MVTIFSFFILINIHLSTKEFTTVNIPGVKFG